MALITKRFNKFAKTLFRHYISTDDTVALRRLRLAHRTGFLDCQTLAISELKKLVKQESTSVEDCVAILENLTRK